MKIPVDIGKLNKRITIQKLSLTTDEYGNQIQQWSDFYTCWAAVSGINNREYWQARRQNEENILNFQIRHSKELKDINKTDYRIIFDNRIFDISFIDNLQFADSIFILKGIENV